MSGQRRFRWLAQPPLHSPHPVLSIPRLLKGQRISEKIGAHEEVGLKLLKQVMQL